MNFETDEALLTGESLPVQKVYKDIYPPETGPGDRLNVAYSSSTVTKGRARGVVFATGMKTEIVPLLTVPPNRLACAQARAFGDIQKGQSCLTAAV